MGKRVFLSLSILLFFLIPAYGQDIIIFERRHPPQPIPTPVRRFHPMVLKKHHIQSEIQDQVASTKVQQTFYNPNPWELEGKYIFPIPGDSALSDFSLTVNGKEMKGEVLEKEKARKIYQDIVASLRDPALLEFIGTGLLQAQIYPIPAQGEVSIQLRYSQLLPKEGSLYSYRYPFLNPSATSPSGPDYCSADIRILSRLPIKNVYSPTLPLDVVREGENKVRISYEGRRPEKDLILYYSLSEDPFGLNLLSFRKPGEDGFFLLLLSPQETLKPSQVLEKDIVFVLDTSGSMVGKKIEQARGALLFCLNSLNRGDRFNIVTFATETRALQERLIPVTDQNLEMAREFVKEIAARGGTNINEALTTAYSSTLQEDRPLYVVFLTDGLPTVGETRPESILENVKKSSGGRGRLFVFGVGNDVNTWLLDRLAEEIRGTRDYVAESEDIEVRVSSFYDKINYPVLSDLELEFLDIRTYDVYPRRVPDLFKGSQITVLGRYQGAGKKAVKLSGNFGKERKVFLFDAPFCELEKEREFIPMLWAIRKVGYLLDEIRLHGESKELKEEIVRLSKEYGILSPYTASLVTEDLRRTTFAFHGQPPPAPQGGAATTIRGGTEPGLAPGSESPEEALAMGRMRQEGFVGGDAVNGSKALKKMKEGESISPPGIKGKDIPELGKGVTFKKVGKAIFYLIEGVWVDHRIQAGEEKGAVRVPAFEEEYFKLLEENPDVKDIFALGEKVLFRFKGKIYKTF